MLLPLVIINYVSCVRILECLNIRTLTHSNSEKISNVSISAIVIDVLIFDNFSNKIFWKNLGEKNSGTQQKIHPVFEQ